MEHEPMVKRRCGMSLFPSTPPGTSSGLNLSGRGSSPGPSRHHSMCGSPVSLNRGIKRVKRRLLDADHYSVRPTTPPTSLFLCATPPLETGLCYVFLGGIALFIPQVCFVVVG